MDLTADERDIVQYLKSWNGRFVSAKEISRRAGGKRKHQEDERWALRLLPMMKEKGVVVADEVGHYRLPEDEYSKSASEKKKRNKKWVSPQIEQILKNSGKKFEIIDGNEP